MVKISVVCCYNDEHMFQQIFVPSLNMQKEIEYELIGVNNNKGVFSSAASAINYGIRKSIGSVVVVVHQDFEFLSEYALKQIYEYSISYNDNVIVGVAGAILDKDANFLRRFIGRNRIIYASLQDSKNKISEPMIVESLDECCFAFKKYFWKEHPLDEATCNKWDLYAVDMCLQARKSGGNALVIPVASLHHSGGNITKNFYVVLRKLSRKYQNSVKIIVTTCVVTDTTCPTFEFLKLTFINMLRVRRKKNESNLLFTDTKL